MGLAGLLFRKCLLRNKYDLNFKARKTRRKFQRTVVEIVNFYPTA